MELTAPANEGSVMINFAQTNTNSITMLMIPSGFVASVMAQARSEWSNGKPGQLRVQFSSVSSGMNESTDVPIVMERTAGQNTELAAWLQRHGSVGGQGLTTEEHDALIITQAAVTAEIGPGLGDLIQTIGGLITRPPMGIGSLSSPAYELEGDGEIPDISDILHSRFGLYWVATVIPAGLGHLHGQTEEYLERLVQFRTVHVLDSTELVTEVLDANYHGALWAWSTPKPSRVEYSIIPGVHLQVRWWQFP